MSIQKAWGIILLLSPLIKALALPTIVERATPIAHADMNINLHNILMHRYVVA